jgi:hypothetical protein
MLGQVANPWWVFIILGLFTGILSGALGVGGGIVIVPTLVILAGLSQKSAQGMSLAIMVPLALLGAYRYWREQTVDINLLVIGLIVIGALAGTLIGTELALRLPGHVLRKAFAVFLVLVAARMFIGADKAAPTTAGQNKVNTGANIEENEKADHD